MTQDTLTTLRAALEALEMQQTGLRWYRSEMPEHVNGSDDEADALVNNLTEKLAALIAAMEKSEPDFVYEGYERGSELLSALEGVADGTGLWMQKPVEQPLSDAKDAARWNWWAKAVSEHDMNSLEEAFKDIPHDSPTSKQALDSAVDAAIEQAIRSKQA